MCIIPRCCNACLNTDCIEHVDEGDQIDSDGEFGNHYLYCTVCGKRTDSMDTIEDAIDAFNNRCDAVHYSGASTVLLRAIDVVALSGKNISVRDVYNMDIRNRVNSGY